LPSNINIGYLLPYYTSVCEKSRLGKAQKNIALATAIEVGFRSGTRTKNVRDMTVASVDQLAQMDIFIQLGFDSVPRFSRTLPS
jgi:hypothetical protein